MWISIIFLYSIVCGVGLLLMYAAIRLSRVSLTSAGRGAILGSVTTVVIASCLPFIIGWTMKKPIVIYAVPEFQPMTVTTITSDSASPIPSTLNLWSTLCTVYIIGVTLSLLKVIITISRIILLTKNAECRGKVYLTDRNNLVPFSWGGRIFMSCKDYESNGEILLAHENAHRDAHHWIDLLVLNLLGCLTWYCPAASLIRRELQLTHEFAADLAVIQAGFEAKAYQLLLISKATGRRFANSVTDCINNHSLKSRIIMMQKNFPMRRRLRSSLALIPAGLVIIALASSPALAEKAEALMPTDIEVITPENTTAPNELLIAGMENPVQQSQAKQTSETTEQQSVKETPAKDEPKQETIFTEVEQTPKYPGGDMEMFDFINKNLRYPEECADRNIQGRVVVQFEVKKDGSIGKAKVARSVDPQLDGEAIRIVRSFPKFTPGTMNGTPVNVWYTLPFNFKLQ
ncbi:MAG: TonB family protein [Muribaculaceae bacterium]|nr:TonB family protein [Muribaculaceae bacterium]